MHALPRRVFVKGIVRVLAILGLNAMGGFLLRSGRGGADATLRDRLAAMFAAPEDARAVGMAYLASDPEGRRRSMALASALRVAGADRPDELSALLRRRREGDFRADRVVVLDGWVLSATEAQACALVSLL